MDTTDMTGLQNLQRALDATIERLGIERTTALLNNLGKDTGHFEANRFETIARFLAQTTIRIYGVDENDFFNGGKDECREARMICYDLLKSHTDCSYSRLVKVFGGNGRSILYYRQKCRDQLSAPYFYKDFVQKHKKLETMLLAFIAELD